MAKNGENRNDGDPAVDGGAVEDNRDLPITKGEQVVAVGGDGPLEMVLVSGSDAPSTGSAGSPLANNPIIDPEVGEARAEDAAAVRELELANIDPVTNQSASDFFPVDPMLDERSQELILAGKQASGVEGRVAALNKVRQTRRDQEARQERSEAALKQVESDHPLPTGKEQVLVDPATYRARMFARNQAEARTIATSTTIPGGRYVVNGRVVNAHGDVIDDEGNVLQKA